MSPIRPSHPLPVGMAVMQAMQMEEPFCISVVTCHHCNECCFYMHFMAEAVKCGSCGRCTPTGAPCWPEAGEPTALNYEEVINELMDKDPNIALWIRDRVKQLAEEQK